MPVTDAGKRGARPALLAPMSPGVHNGGLTGSVTVQGFEAPSPRSGRWPNSLGRHRSTHQPGFLPAAETTAWTRLIDDPMCAYLVYDLIFFKTAKGCD
jgi:hypothetical protein